MSMGIKLILADLNTDSDEEEMIERYWVFFSPKGIHAACQL